MTLWWCERALLPDGVRRGVTIETAGDRILNIHPDSATPGGATSLPGLTIPGLANSHSHAFHRALRSRTQVGAGSFWTWRDVMYEAANRLNPDIYHRLARAVYGEMALAGQTVVGEFHYLHHQPSGTPYAYKNAMGEALLAAADDVGIRITLLDTMYLHGGLSADGYAPPGDGQRRYRDADADAWAARVDTIRPGPDQRIGAAIHSVRAVDPDSMRVAVDWSNGRASPLHAHVSEQVAENEACQANHGSTPVELLAGVGALGQRFSAIHATHLTETDVAKLGTSGSSVCFCPTTERDLGDGIGPSRELVSAGVALHLGSDSHAVIDPFEEARAVELNERLRSEQRGLFLATELLTMATVNGHRALGWDDGGTLAAGKRADLVTLRLDSVRTAGAPDDHAAETIVFACSATDVTSVVTGGRLIVSDGQHVGFDVVAELDQTIKELFG